MKVAQRRSNHIFVIEFVKLYHCQFQYVSFKLLKGLFIQCIYIHFVCCVTVAELSRQISTISSNAGHEENIENVGSVESVKNASVLTPKTE